MIDDRVYLPASSHELWVAYFDEDNLRLLPKDDPVESVVLVEPVIGWVISIQGEYSEDIALPMTPDHGVVGLPGFNRRIGVSPQGVQKEMCRAADAMRHRWGVSG